MNFDTLFQQQHALPTIPKVVQELINSFNDEDVSVDEISRKLVADQVLSAKILRLANSSYYHVSRSVGSVDDAVLMLGFMTVRTLVVSSGLVGGFKAMPGLDLKKFWRYSLHTAVIAKWLSKKLKLNSDFAFTVGMMHAIGQLVMHAAMPEQMLEIDKVAGAFDARRFGIERQSFGYDFSTVGAELATRWKFPQEFAIVIRSFPDPLDHERFESMGGLIHLAAWRARAQEHDVNRDELIATFPVELGRKMGVTAEMMADDMPPLAELCEGLDSLIA